MRVMEKVVDHLKKNTLTLFIVVVTTYIAIKINEPVQALPISYATNHTELIDMSITLVRHNHYDCFMADKILNQGRSVVLYCDDYTHVYHIIENAVLHVE